MIVVDASALLELLLRSDAAEEVERRLRGRGMCAPHLIDAELAQALRRFAARGEMHEERGRRAIDLLVDFPLRRYPFQLLLPRIWQLRHNLTAYDAAYVALAEALDAPLVTRDRRLAAAAGSGVTIEVV